jgi:hypothetical protein
MPVNPSTWENEAGGLKVEGYPGLHRETVSRNKIHTHKKKTTPIKTSTKIIKIKSKFKNMV